MYSSIESPEAEHFSQPSQHQQQLVLDTMLPIVFPYGTDWDILLSTVPASSLPLGVQAYTECSMETTLVHIYVASEAEGDLLKWLITHELVELRDIHHYNAFYQIATHFINNKKQVGFILNNEKERRNRQIEKEVKYILGMVRPSMSLLNS